MQPLSPSHTEKAPNCFLITGGTGFLGFHLIPLVTFLRVYIKTRKCKYVLTLRLQFLTHDDAHTHTHTHTHSLSLSLSLFLSFSLLYISVQDHHIFFTYMLLRSLSLSVCFCLCLSQLLENVPFDSSLLKFFAFPSSFRLLLLQLLNTGATLRVLSPSPPNEIFKLLYPTVSFIQGSILDRDCILKVFSILVERKKEWGRKSFFFVVQREEGDGRGLLFTIVWILKYSLRGGVVSSLSYSTQTGCRRSKGYFSSCWTRNTQSAAAICQASF